MNEVDTFLFESNKIEGVFDFHSLDDARVAWDFLIGEPELTGKAVRKTHALLMKNQPIMRHQIGKYRREPVWVGGREGTKWTRIPYETDLWIAAMNSKEPVRDWKELHVLYENIHPFIGGNGRTGRMFMNWHRVVICGLPLLTINSRERYEYYEWFKAVGRRHQESS